MSNSKLSPLDENNLSTPCLVMDLSLIDKSYKQMTNLFPKLKYIMQLRLILHQNYRLFNNKDHILMF